MKKYRMIAFIVCIIACLFSFSACELQPKFNLDDQATPDEVSLFLSTKDTSRLYNNLGHAASGLSYSVEYEFSCYYRSEKTLSEASVDVNGFVSFTDLQNYAYKYSGSYCLNEQHATLSGTRLLLPRW